MSLLEEHQRKAKADPKTYYRDKRAKWANAAESNALKCEAAARDARLRNDESMAKMHDEEARGWRVLIRN